MKTVMLMLCWFGMILSSAHAAPFQLPHDGKQLSGQYLPPLGDAVPSAVVLFVHGDGAMPADAHGYYPLIWQTLRRHGIAVVSWAKPGVDESEGNWLAQTMAQRQQEVLAVAKWVQETHGISPQRTGLIGFSQAGWVVPALAAREDRFGFAIGIGYAVSWIDQGRYYTRQKYTQQRLSPAQIAAKLREYDEEIAFFQTEPTYAEYAALVGEAAMTPERFTFVMKNFLTDARQDYPRIRIPTLLLWGEDDLNVDARHEYQFWQRQPHPKVTTALLTQANHGLFDSEMFPRQAFSWWEWLKMTWLQEEALAEAFLPTLMGWLEGQGMLNGPDTAANKNGWAVGVWVGERNNTTL
ncbi:alpha/beta hydrolase family protein [Photobacterium sp. TY1-4]|uniref:alpha/beta hydrolase family protein n=1 Tax=Photobacterium sp. TY1-4 TaxID=2899122 RepID=UPI0021C0AA2B|nr:alpha/beta fold hydrolase [Photobacterium sp. TY1-4]UXI03586.1 alpha/beta fold hydrolase [Photobacterium sp. TY1-4]